MKKYDNLILGVGLGLVSVFITIVAFYLIKFSDTTFSEYLDALFSYKRTLSAMISLSGLPNLLFFFLFLNKEKYKTAKGLITATFVLVLIVVVIKVFL